ncbi:MAG: hypothetical protein KGP29_06735 [Proteobacteria bacterium]|nr:hypothetical protein [Pseudomonadota bacterium]
MARGPKTKTSETPKSAQKSHKKKEKERERNLFRHLTIVPLFPLVAGLFIASKLLDWASYPFVWAGNSIKEIDKKNNIIEGVGDHVKAVGGAIKTVSNLLRGFANFLSPCFEDENVHDDGTQELGKAVESAAGSITTVISATSVVAAAAVGVSAFVAKTPFRVAYNVAREAVPENFGHQLDMVVTPIGRATNVVTDGIVTAVGVPADLLAKTPSPNSYPSEPSPSSRFKDANLSKVANKIFNQPEGHQTRSRSKKNTTSGKPGH